MCKQLIPLFLYKMRTEAKVSNERCYDFILIYEQQTESSKHFGHIIVLNISH